MSEPNLNIKLADKGTTVSSSRKGRSQLPLFIGGGLLVMLAVIVGFFLLQGGEQIATEETPQAVTAEQEEKDKEEVVSTTKVEVEDDGQILWVSPTAGQPISRQFVPPGTQLLLHVKVAELLSHPEGEKIVAALGPWGATALDSLEEFTGARGDEIESLLLCIYPNTSGELGYTLRCNLKTAWDQTQLGRRFTESSQTSHGNQPFFVRQKRACFLPVDGDGKTLVSCPLAEVAELIESDAEGPPLARDLERLLSRTDQQRGATLLFPMKFLQTSGHDLLRGTAEDLQLALRELVADDAAVVAFSADWGENFFLELQSTVAFRKRPHGFALAVKRRMAEAPAVFAKAVLESPLPSYGEKIIARLPAMLRQVSDHTRSGAADGISIMRCYLPLSAGHNLLMAAELTLNTRSLALASSHDQVPHSAQPTTLAAKLRQTTTLSFAKETLERALEMLSEDIRVPIELRGSDLQLEGITKNQSFGIDLQGRPAAEILLAVLQQANPDRTASGPADTKQKLVYRVREAADGQPGAIVVTTRSAAAKAGHKLPATFETK